MEQEPKLLQGEGYLRLQQVLNIFPVSKSTWWDGVKRGKYPPAVKLSERVTAWRAADIKKLLENTHFFKIKEL